MAKSKSAALQTRLHNRDLRYRQKVKGFENALVRKASVSLTAATYGTLQRYAVKNDVGGFPWKLGVWLGATLVEALSGSQVLTSFSAGVSDATLAIYMDRTISQKTFIGAEQGGEI